MKAVRIHEHGDFDALVVEEIPTPEPSPGEVRVKVAWAALNHLDTWVRRGVPGHEFPLPLIPGCDFSGTVDVVGPEAGKFEVGDRVCIAPGFGCGRCQSCSSGRQNLCRRYGIYGETVDGGNAEFAVVNEENLIPVPDDFPLDIAAAFPLTYLTAWHMVVDRCEVKSGDRVLVHAAGSGVSVAAAQIARMWGAEVMVTAGTDSKVAQGCENGAEFGVNYLTEDWVKAGKRWTEGKGFDIIVDHVGIDTLPKGIWALAKGGRIVTCGVTSGAEMKIHFAPIFFKSLSILGSTMGGHGEQLEVAKHVFAGRLKPVVAHRFPMEEVAEAHRMMSERGFFGKILLQIDSESPASE
ncbi:MAG TPA: alcohol dehydrogenase [Planctomycetes bacterium]|nr:alcohol dehydrogenase [Planctomycetota bacterium]